MAANAGYRQACPQPAQAGKGAVPVIRTTISDGHNKFVRITQTQARKRWAANEPLYVIAHKMRPGRPFSMGMTVFPAQYPVQTFDQMLANFCFHNANCHETGLYAAYYIETPLLRAVVAQAAVV